jgi:integrase/recombinase XerD
MTPVRRPMTPWRRRMIEDMTLRNFAPRTIEIYLERVATFAQYFHTSPERLGPEHIRGYLLHLIQERHVSWGYFNQARCALQFLDRVTLGGCNRGGATSFSPSPRVFAHHPARVGHLGKRIA